MASVSWFYYKKIEIPSYSGFYRFSTPKDNPLQKLKMWQYLHDTFLINWLTFYKMICFFMAFSVYVYPSVDEANQCFDSFKISLFLFQKLSIIDHLLWSVFLFIFHFFNHFFFMCKRIYQTYKICFMWLCSTLTHYLLVDENISVFN